MSKILITAAAAVASTVALSAQSDSVQPNSAFNGFYVGAAAGYSSLDAKEKVSIINPTNAEDSDTVSFSPSLKSNNFAGSAHFGYGSTFAQKWYLGTEVSIIFDNHNTKYKFNDTNDGSSFSDTLSRKYAMTINIMPGYFLKDDILLNLKAGASLSRFTYKMEDDYQTNDPVDASYLSDKRTNNLAGFNIGASIRISTTEKLSLRLDVDHTIYRNFRVTKRQDEEHKITTNIKPTVTTVMAGFSYKI